MSMLVSICCSQQASAVVKEAEAEVKGDNFSKVVTEADTEIKEV